MSNSYRHYVITTRPVRKVHLALKDLFYYEKDNADKPNWYLHFGQYTEMQKKAYAVPGMPEFFNPQGEELDYTFNGPDIPDENIKPGQLTRERLGQIFDSLEKAQKDILFFIFGYDNDFQKELNHVEKLHDAYLNSSNSIGELIMITWPSQGMPWQYYDELKNDVKVTAKALSVFLLKLKAFSDERKKENKYVPGFHIIIQSMGNRIADAMATVLKEANRMSQLNKLFTRMILMAPDMPDHALNNDSVCDYKLLPSMSSRTYVVYSKGDMVIKPSKIFHMSDRQLGSNGPDKGINKDVFIVQIVQKAFNSNIPDSNQNGWWKELVKTHRYFEYNDNAIVFFERILACADGNMDNKTHNRVEI